MKRKFKRIFGVLLVAVMTVSSMLSTNGFAKDSINNNGLPEGAYKVYDGIYAVDDNSDIISLTNYKDINIGTLPEDEIIVQPSAMGEISIDAGDKWLCIRSNAYMRINFVYQNTLMFGADYMQWPAIGASPNTIYYIDVEYHNFITGVPYAMQCMSGDGNAHNNVIISLATSIGAENDDSNNERLKDYGIMVGDENGNFNPYQALTRAELTKIAVVMSNPDFMENVNLDEQSFSDVSSEHWAHPYIEYAKANGIIDGYEDGTFKPEQYVTVQEMLKIMICLVGYEPQAEVTGGYPYGYIKSAMRLGLLEGITVQYDTYTIRTETADVINKVLDTPLMVQTGEGEYIICDGSALEYPLSTIAIKNFAE